MPDASELRSPSLKGRMGRPLSCSANRKLYDNLDVRLAILELLDRGDLATMMRVERTGMGIVAGILYREVTAKQMSGMSRSDARQELYADAVRVLDRNSPPYSTHYRQMDCPPPPPPPPGQQFDADPVLAYMRTCRTLFPYLSKVIYSYPPKEADDAYVAHIDQNGRITVDLESRWTINVLTDPFPTSPPKLPPTPNYGGIVVRHTIVVRLVAQASEREYGRLERARREDESFEKWREWLYSTGGPGLDRRVVGLDHYPLIDSPAMRVNPVNIMSIIEARASKGYQPLHTLFISGRIQLQLLLDPNSVLRGTMGDDLRTLAISSATLDTFQEPQVVIHLLDMAFPRLENLIMVGDLENGYDFASALPLRGMRALRSVSLSYISVARDYDSNDTPEEVEERRRINAVIVRAGDGDEAIQAFLCHLGSADCAYIFERWGPLDAIEREEFQKEVRAMKASSYRLSAEQMARRKRANELAVEWHSSMVDYIEQDSDGEPEEVSDVVDESEAESDGDSDEESEKDSEEESEWDARTLE